MTTMKQNDVNLYRKYLHITPVFIPEKELNKEAPELSKSKFPPSWYKNKSVDQSKGIFKLK